MSNSSVTNARRPQAQRGVTGPPTIADLSEPGAAMAAGRYGIFIDAR